MRNAWIFGILVASAMLALVMPAVADASSASADSAVQQNHISSEMQKLTERLQLTPAQARTLRASMEAVVHGTAKETVDQTLKRILSPAQLDAWEQVKAGSVLAEAGRSAAEETGEVARMFGLSEAQKHLVFQALYPIAVEDPKWAHSSAELFANLDRDLKRKEAALAKILTPAQLLIYDQRARYDLERMKEFAGASNEPLTNVQLGVTNPPAQKDFTPVTPLALDALPDTNLQYRMPKAQGSVIESDDGPVTYAGGTTVVVPASK